MLTKPPLGVSPHWFVYRSRMKELNEAIARYLEYIENHCHIRDMAPYHKAVAIWSRELEQLALLEAEITDMEKKS